MPNSDLLNNTARAMSVFATEQRVLVGFDGFIDEIIHLVDRRQSVDQFTRIEKMADFGGRIAAAAGKSCNIEMVVAQAKLGGNGPIMANAMQAQGKRVVYMGALGANGIHPLFQDFAKGCEGAYSFSDPGHTDACEFYDGKVMLGKMQALNGVNWDALVAKIGAQKVEEIIRKMDLIACVNWTMLPYMNSILLGMQKILGAGKKRVPVFIDLTDPRKRTKEDLLGVLNLLSSMQTQADMILGLNEGESQQVTQALGLGEQPDLKVRARLIRNKLGIHMTVVHPTIGAAVSSGSGEFYIDGPYTKTPKLTTGAGDNFNAGFCTGYLAGLKPEECLVTGVCTSGFYVRNCHSPSKEELVAFMKKWVAANGAEF